MANSKNKHYVRDITNFRDPDGSSKVGVYDATRCEFAHEDNMFKSTTGTSSVSYWNFSSSRRDGYSDLEVVAHEMRHQLDIDKGRYPRTTYQQELNAVSTQNYIRNKEGKPSKTDYKRLNFKFSKEELNNAHDKLNNIINKALSEGGNTTINFY